MLQHPLARELQLHAIDLVLDNYGIESIRGPEGAFVADYSNTGDTYATTVLWDNLDCRWRITSYGDHIEALERKGIHCP